MIKYALLSGAMTLAIPAFAQTAPTTNAPARSAPAAQTAAPVPAPAPTTSTTPATTQAAPTAHAAPAPATGQVAQQPAPPATTQPAAGPAQVAQVVEQEFPTYDANKDGNLSSTEFDDWMVALKKASDPSVNATAPDTVKWNQAAFAQADTDKNKSISKTELTAFLSKAAG